MTNTAHKPSTASKIPSHAAYHVRDREDGEGFWTRIGSAWAHSDGHGLTLQIDTVPLDGRLVLRTVSDKK